MTLLRNAPPVVYPVGRSRFLGSILGMLWLAGILLVAGAWWQSHLAGLRVLAAGTVVLLAGALAWQFWCRLPHGSLRWDGAAWWIESVGTAAPALPGELRVRLDLQRHLLLAWRPAPDTGAGERRFAGWRGPPKIHWLWADAGTDPARWHGLRCAVYSFRAMTDAPDGAADP